MRYTKFAAVTLAAVMLMAGCGKKDSETEKVTVDEAVMTVGGIDVTPGIYTYFYNAYNTQTGDSELSRGLAIDECESGYMRIAVANAMGVELTDEQKENMENDKNQVISIYGDNYKTFLEDNNLTEEDIDTIISMGYYTEALSNQIDAVEITDEVREEYFKNHYRRAKHILITTEATDGDDDEAKALAEELLKRAQSGEDFDALIEEYSEDPGSQSNPDGYVFTDNEMVSEFQDGVDSIGVGEFTLVKSSYGYHVIERLALDETPEYFAEAYQGVKENIDEVIETGLFDDQLEAWKEEYNIETVVYDEVIDKLIASLE